MIKKNIQHKLQDIEEPKNCNRFEFCEAPLCPLDRDVDLRCWYFDEEVCKSRKYGQPRWIKKQRLIQRKQYKKYYEVPLTYKMLYKLSRPKKISPEAKEKMRLQFKRNMQSEQKGINRIGF